MCNISINLKSVIILFSSSKLCTCILNLGWFLLPKNASRSFSTHTYPSLPFDNICNFWLEPTYFPGIRFKRIYIRNVLSGPFGKTRNKRKRLKGH